jgi:predicted RND superfamily exporter protein
MLITTIVLSTGFLGFVLSSMHNLTNLGILVSFAIVTAFFADVLLAPALLALVDRDASKSRS